MRFFCKSCTKFVPFFFIASHFIFYIELGFYWLCNRRYSKIICNHVKIVGFGSVQKKKLWPKIPSPGEKPWTSTFVDPFFHLLSQKRTSQNRAKILKIWQDRARKNKIDSIKFFGTSLQMTNTNEKLYIFFQNPKKNSNNSHRECPVKE